MTTAYNFAESLSRIDTVLSSDNLVSVRGIPSVDEIKSSKVYLPQATVVHVNFEIISDIWHLYDEKKELPVIQSFVSEAMIIGKSSSCCQDIMVTEKYLRMVYETSLKSELNEALDDAARVRTLAMVVSKKAKKRDFPMIKASIGMDYGQLAMLPINLNDNRFPRCLWTGKAIGNAEKNAGFADDDIVISDSVWKNLTENNRKLFEAEHLLSSVFRGKIVNIAMNNWLAK